MAIAIPVIHAHCMDEVTIDGSFLCCYETDSWNSCDQHTPIDTTNDEILSNTFSPTEKIKKVSSKIFLNIGRSKRSSVFTSRLWRKILFEKDTFPILSQQLRAYTKEIKKRE